MQLKKKISLSLYLSISQKYLTLDDSLKNKIKCNSYSYYIFSLLVILILYV